MIRSFLLPGVCHDPDQFGMRLSCLFIIWAWVIEVFNSESSDDWTHVHLRAISAHDKKDHHAARSYKNNEGLSDADIGHWKKACLQGSSITS